METPTIPSWLVDRLGGKRVSVYSESCVAHLVDPTRNELSDVCLDRLVNAQIRCRKRPIEPEQVDVSPVADGPMAGWDYRELTFALNVPHAPPLRRRTASLRAVQERSRKCACHSINYSSVPRQSA